jgi:hypothetical protein
MAATTRSSTSSAFWEAKTNPVEVENNDALKFPFSFNSLSTSSSRLTTVNTPLNSFMILLIKKTYYTMYIYYELFSI